MRHAARNPRPQSRFPFVADYTDTFAGVELKQRVNVLEHFGHSYRVKSEHELHVPALKKPVPAGVSFLLPIESICRLAA